MNRSFSLRVENSLSACTRKRSARRALLIALTFVGSLPAVPRLHAQGCIVARSPEQILPGIDQNGLPTGQGGFLQPGHFQLTIGERHQFSYQHFVGDVYQEYRAQLQNQVENRDQYRYRGHDVSMDTAHQLRDQRALPLRLAQNAELSHQVRSARRRGYHPGRQCLGFESRRSRIAATPRSASAFCCRQAMTTCRTR